MGLHALATLVALTLPGGADDLDHEAAAFQAEVAPMMARYCRECHAGRKPKGGFNLAKYPDVAAVEKDRKTWEKVLENIEAGAMPPEGEPQPTEEEVTRLTAWVQSRLSKADCQTNPDPGHVTLRRLNRAEYNNTIRDLVGVDFHPADDFPSDDVGYGFDNIGDVLTLPPVLLERYLAAAAEVAERAIDASGRGDLSVRRLQARRLGDFDGETYKGRYRILSKNGEIGQKTFYLTKTDEYAIRIRAFGQQAGDEPVKMALRLGNDELKVFEVAATEDEPGVYEYRGPVQGQGRSRKFSIALLNDFQDEETKADRNLVVESIEIRGPLSPEGRGLRESHRRLIFREPQENTPEERRACAREILERFASRAYRRPATGEEVERLVGLVEMVTKDGERFEKGIQLAVQAVLVSPNFLFRVELDPEGAAPEAVVPLNDHELASRLSYFLWSSMPDEELFGLAAEGTLHEPAVLEAQARRMMRDPKAKALVENFAGQWLQIRNLKTISPDPETFPAFDEDLRAAMQGETERFFEHVMREDRSILELLDADYTFVNERLAKHYGIEGVSGEEFRKVDLPEGSPRGGILTQASILTITSNPTRTSPVKRGKWVLEQLLGTPPPPPPPDVPELKEGKDVVLTGTLRQRMEQHRTNPDCAACHARMDPLGFGLENFDAVGAWREADGPFPVDASGTLPSGQSFDGPKQLKAILAGKADAFARCLAEKMLTYALGRGLEFPDRCAVDTIVAGLSADDDRFSALVARIVTSDPFRKRKGEGGTE